jgi:hypothetical protein
MLDSAIVSATYTINSGATPLSIFAPSAAPADSPNTSDPVTLGVKFRSDVAGTVTGIRFYKGTGNSGAHIGLLYNSAGTLLAQATFTGVRGAHPLSW